MGPTILPKANHSPSSPNKSLSTTLKMGNRPGQTSGQKCVCVIMFKMTEITNIGCNIYSCDMSYIDHAGNLFNIYGNYCDLWNPFKKQFDFRRTIKKMKWRKKEHESTMSRRAELLLGRRTKSFRGKSTKEEADLKRSAATCC